MQQAELKPIWPAAKFIPSLLSATDHVYNPKDLYIGK